MCCIIHGSASTFAHTHKARSAKRLAHANVRVLLRAQRCKRWEKVSSHPIELLWLQYSRVKWLLKNKRCPFATNKWFLVMPFWQLFPFDERNNTHFGSYWGTFKFFEANRLPFCTGIFAIFLACSSTVSFCALILPRVYSISEIITEQNSHSLRKIWRTLKSFHKRDIAPGASTTCGSRADVSHFYGFDKCQAS